MICFTCNYCGHKWYERYYPMHKQLQCSICNDKSIRDRKEHEEKIDYYQGSPPFPEKKIEVKQEVKKVEVEPPKEEEKQEELSIEDFFDLYY